MSIKNKLTMLIESKQEDILENELLEAVRKKIKESEKDDKEEAEEDGKNTIDGKAGDAVTIENPLDSEAKISADAESGDEAEKEQNNDDIKSKRGDVQGKKVQEGKTVDDDGDYDDDKGIFKSDKRENDAIKGKRGDVQKAKAKDDDIQREMQEFKDLLASDESLSEEFKEKAGIVFQALLAEKTKEISAQLQEEFSAKTAALQVEHDALVESLEGKFELKLEEATKEQELALSEKIDGYFGRLSEEWINENELALEAGITAELTESFMTGLKTLFEEHYVNLPEDKRDLVEEIQIKLAAAEKALATSLAESTDIKKQFETVKREQIIEETAKGMTDLDASRFKSLMEDFEFETESQYSKKSQIVKDSFFSVKKSLTEDRKEVKKIPQVQIIEETILLEEPSAMSQYVKAINGSK